MHPQSPEQSARSGQRGLLLWFGAVLMLALLLAAPLAAELAHPGNQVAPASLEIPTGGAPPDVWLSKPSDLPHCHHDHAWRPASGVLPRSEAPDDTPDPPTLIASVVGPSPHLTSPLGHAHPGPPVWHSVPLYLLTQRFRS